MLLCRVFIVLCRTLLTNGGLAFIIVRSDRRILTTISMNLRSDLAGGLLSPWLTLLPSEEQAIDFRPMTSKMITGGQIQPVESGFERVQSPPMQQILFLPFLDHVRRDLKFCSSKLFRKDNGCLITLGCVLHQVQTRSFI